MTESDGTLQLSFRAMATDIRVEVVRPGPGAHDAVAAVRELFGRVEAECTRFDPSSDLMRANSAGVDWAPVGPLCFRALAAAAHAHARTRGLFDPRVLTTLENLGYDMSLPFDAGTVSITRTAPAPVAPHARWHPQLDEEHRQVRIGPEPIDLGGIAKGLAVRWAGQRLEGTGSAYLVEAGGDCRLGGAGPEGKGWHVGVEDPRGGTGPVAVLSLTDTACATSSIRRRRWNVGGIAAHHLIDPRTGSSGGAGLLAVTVVGPDPADDEVWSKVLFLHGSSDIAQVAGATGLTALWVHVDGTVDMTDTFRPLLLWQAAA